MDQGVGSAGPSGFVDGNASGARAYAVLSLFAGCGGMDLGSGIHMDRTPDGDRLQRG